MNAKGINLTELNLGNKANMSTFKDGIAKYATDHQLAYGREMVVPDSLGTVTQHTYYGKVYNRVVNFLNSLGSGYLNCDLMPTGNDMRAASEGFYLSSVTEDKIGSAVTQLFELCKDSDIPSDRIAATVESLGTLLFRYTNNNTDDHFKMPTTSTLPGLRSLSSIYPAAVTQDVSYHGGLAGGSEMFGANIQHKVVDIKTAMTITLVKSYKGTTNRLIHRIANDTGYMLFIVPNDEYYDLAKSKGKLSEERDSWSHRNQMLTLRTHPEAVDMELSPVQLQKKLDTSGRFLLANDVIKPGVELSLWDLSTIEGKAGFELADYTELLSNEIHLRALHIEITDGTATEQYVLNLSTYHSLTSFTDMNNTLDNQADRACIFKGMFPFDKDSINSGNGRTNLFSTLTRSVEYVMGRVNFTATTNIQTTKTHGSGSIEFKSAVSTAGEFASPELKTLLGKLSAKIIGWEIDARFSEENFRKTHMAVRAMSDVFSYTVPDGKTIVADHSHKQALAEHVIQVGSEVQTIGIDHRNLQLFLKTIRATSDRIRNERTDKRYIENYDNLTVNKAFVSGRRVHPTIAIKTIDMTKMKNWKSSDMLSDQWTYMRACMNAITTELNYRSLMLQALEDKAVKYKVLTTTPMLDCIWSLANIHENQMPGGKEGEMVFDTKKPGQPVEFKTKLPNGVELEFVTTAFHYVKNMMMLIPYREGQPMDDLNFAVNLDGGQYSVNWTPTDGNQQTIRRSMLNTREYPITLCGVAALITVTGYDHLTPGMFEI